MGTKEGLKARLRFYYLVGFFAWLFAITTIFLLPRSGLLKKKCRSCEEYSRFVAELIPERKSRLVMFEGGVVHVADRFFYLGELSEDEPDLERSGLIAYRKLSSDVDEKTRRLIIVNSILDSMDPEVRNLILKNEAAILYRKGEFLMVAGKDALESLKTNID